MERQKTPILVAFAAIAALAVQCGPNPDETTTPAPSGEPETTEPTMANWKEHCQTDCDACAETVRDMFNEESISQEGVYLTVAGMNPATQATDARKYCEQMQLADTVKPGEELDELCTVNCDACAKAVKRVVAEGLLPGTEPWSMKDYPKESAEKARTECESLLQAEEG